MEWTRGAPRPQIGSSSDIRRSPHDENWMPGRSPHTTIRSSCRPSGSVASLTFLVIRYCRNARAALRENIYRSVFAKEDSTGKTKIHDTLCGRLSRATSWTLPQRPQHYAYEYGKSHRGRSRKLDEQKRFGSLCKTDHFDPFARLRVNHSRMRRRNDNGPRKKTATAGNVRRTEK